MLLGVDVGGTAVKAGIVTPDGGIRSFAEFPVDYANAGNPLFEATLSAVRRYIREYGDSVRGVGISATGQVDADAGKVIGAEDNNSAYIGTDYRGAVERECGLPAEVLNDADAALLGECAFGAAKGYRDALLVTLGTGVGGAFTVNGRPFLGRRGIAGEFGHTTLYQGGPVCVCGKRGCYQHYASATSLVRRAREATGREIPNAREVFRLLAEEPSGALSRAFDAWVEDIAAGLSSYVHILNPEIVLVGGGVSEQPALLAALREKLRSCLMPRFGEELVIKKAALGNRAGMMGAVRFLLDRRPELEA